MLRNAKELRGFAIHATDGVLGEVKDLYFHEKDWTVRSLVVDTSHWLAGPHVLIPARVVARVDWMAQELTVSLTRAQVEASPEADDGRVAREAHLHGSSTVIGNHVHATDGDIGHVDDLLVDDKTWTIRYLIVDTSNWWLDHRVLVAPQWIAAVHWPEARVSVDLTREAVQKAPPYDSEGQLDRQQEQAIYEHYGHPGYWTSQAIRDAAAPSGTGA